MSPEKPFLLAAHWPLSESTKPGATCSSIHPGSPLGREGRRSLPSPLFSQKLGEQELLGEVICPPHPPRAWALCPLCTLKPRLF